MERNAIPAQAADRGGLNRAQAVAAGSGRGSFMGRQVSAVPGNPEANSPREHRQASATARATARPGRKCSAQAPNRGELDARLEALIRNEKRPAIRDCLERLGSTVRRAEAEVDRMQRLLRQSRKGSLNAAEWREISELFANSKVCQSLRCVGVKKMLEQLTSSSLCNRANTELLTAFLTRLDNVSEYLSFHQAGWLEAGTRSRIEAMLPLQGGKKVAVERYLLPRQAIGAHIRNGYPSEESSKEPGIDRYSTLPGMSAVALSNARGEVLFKGLRHDLFPGGELNDELLARLTDSELGNLIVGLVMSQLSDRPSTVQEKTVLMMMDTIRSDANSAVALEAKSMALSLLQQWAREMAGNDLLAAVLATNRVKRAEENGEEVSPSRLFSIALLKPGDLKLWRHQHEEVSTIGKAGIIDVQLAAQERRLLGRVTTREFAFCVGEDPELQPLCRAVNRAAGMRLLGPPDSPEPGGDLKTALDAKQAIVRSIFAIRAKAQSDHRHLVRELGSTHGRAKSSHRRLCLLDGVARRLEGSAIALEKLGAQVKAMQTPQGDWPSGIAAQRQVAARLALIGYLMDETAVLSCAGGSNLVNRLESHINFLATVTDSAQGVPPEIVLDGRLWQPVLAAFGAPASPPGRGGRHATGPAGKPDSTKCSSLSVPVKWGGGSVAKSSFKVDLLQKFPAGDRHSETIREPRRARLAGNRDPDVWHEQRPQGAPGVSGSDISDVQ